MNTEEYLKSTKPGRHTSALRPFHTDILALRDAGCTLAQIVEFLRVNGVLITLSSVGKYLQKQARPEASRATSRSHAVSPVQVQAVAKPTHSEPPGFKSAEQLRAENPTLPRLQINKLYAQQYDQPKITSADIEDLKRKYPPPPQKTGSA